MSTSTPEKRFRTPRACDSCKRKKKQCSGVAPCTLCQARNQTCVFSNTPASAFSSARSQPRGRSPSSATSDQPRKKRPKSPEPNSATTTDARPRNVWPHVIAAESSRASRDEDETLMSNEGRMLQDGEGRLLYIGDSASLSFLHTVRRLVVSTLGPSPFTSDGNRHRILEASISTPPHYQQTFRLPDLETSLYLAELFFESTRGLFQIFDEETFLAKIKDTYANPLQVNPPWICQLNLVFAVGMQFRRDYSTFTAKEIRIFSRLDIPDSNRSELFFLASKHLSDPISGFEDGGFSSVQSLLLMTIYMLTAAKRNTAWAYLGMATRLAFALGLHKDETMLVFSHADQALRRKLWKSLYVMDIFLSSSLGRPNAISLPELSPSQDQPASNFESPEGEAFLAAYTASKITGEVLSRVYQTRKASRSVALEISMKFSDWLRYLPPKLHWERLSEPDEINLEQIHLNLIYLHGIILLTRPFLLYQINQLLKRSVDLAYDVRTQANCFHGACVRSAVHTVTVVQAAFSKRILRRQDPFVVYWLFSAALVILANAFCPVHYQAEEDSTISIIVQIMTFMAEADIQASRYLHIIQTFNDAIQSARNAKAQPMMQENESQNIFNVLFGHDTPAASNDLQPLMPHEVWTGGMMPDPNNPAMSWDATSQMAQQHQHGMMNNGTDAGYLPQQQGVGGMSWAAGMETQAVDDSIDFDSFWWPHPTPGGGQDNMGAGDVHVPLYGLMKPM
ncbi:hypothetical protein BP5796_01376 [Coleophoma crateriformis]|uniref:Zn(2)-C6 fungal-type domain-containing protein n=1 Tax=Coleophoma crateriformis TaxID=565419 RepID=A0A3D8T087_9HELO|nr:hypothetical protein BP5796_01376 [Coleophoma crateriformis]